jgi:hypothetical protein
MKLLPHTHNNVTNICPIRTGIPWKVVGLKTRGPMVKVVVDSQFGKL